jgi:hypothetical protein
VGAPVTVHAFLGSIPNNLPPETAAVRAITGRALLGAQSWNIYRPMVTTNEAPVEVASIPNEEGTEGLAVRLPAGGQGGYGEFLLAQLGLPIVSVPRARREPTNELSPVTINDWLLYCIVTGDDLDTQVFGHRHPFRDLKRRWVSRLHTVSTTKKWRTSLPASAGSTWPSVLPRARPRSFGSFSHGPRSESRRSWRRNSLCKRRDRSNSVGRRRV